MNDLPMNLAATDIPAMATARDDDGLPPAIGTQVRGKHIASTIALTDRELEILRPARLHQIAGGAETIAGELAAIGATMLVTDTFPSASTLARWRRTTNGTLIVAVLRHGDAITRPQSAGEHQHQRQ